MACHTPDRFGQELVHVKLVQILILGSPCPHWVNTGQFYSNTETESIVRVSPSNLIFVIYYLFYNFLNDLPFFVMHIKL